MSREPAESLRLPILERAGEIRAAIAAHRVVVICGETGSGKTTQLPQICLDMGLGKTGMIGHTQPRRLAARAVAARIAEERGVRVGGLVGAKVRFQDQTSRETAIKVMTDGVLLAEMASDPLLRAYSVIILDEAHERSLNIDFLLGYLRGLVAQRRDLKVIVTSATIDPGRFSEYFGGAGVAPVIEVSGRTFPVEIRYRPVGDDEEEFERIEVEAVSDAVEELMSPRLPAGDVLVFVPGEREIRAAGDALRRRGVDAEVLPLYSRLTNEEQDRIFHPGARRRVIISTNVAETSLTVPGIRYVVDTGYARLNRYDPAKKIQRLPIEGISRASADQRSGRCGRVAAGVCVRLYSEASYRARPRFTDPEIRRTSLAGVILRMKSLRLRAAEEFGFLDPPEAAALRDGYETLFELGAISRAESAGELTAVGEAMSRVPLDPRIARMLLAAEREGSLREVVVLASALSIQDPRERPLGKQEEADRAQLVFRHETSDFITLLRIWGQYSHAAESLSHGSLAGWCRERFVSQARMREWGEMVRQVRDVADELGLRRNESAASEEAIHRALLTGLITNAACREGESGTFEYRGARGNVVHLFPGSVLFKKNPKWIMAAEVVQTSRLFARTVAVIDPGWLEDLAGHLLQRQLSDKHLDAETGEPSAWERLTMSGIVVVPRRRRAIAEIDAAGARRLFMLDGLARGKWRSEAGFMAHNRGVLEEAVQAESKLRRRGIRATDEALAEWFEGRVPAGICEPGGLLSWLERERRGDDSCLRLSLAEALSADGRAALDAYAFPDFIEAEGSPAARWPVQYALAPGKDEDGVTVTIGLSDLPRLDVERAEWVAPGMLEDVVLGLMKSLPKGTRGAIESARALPVAARECAAVLRFGEGSLTAALSEAVGVLLGVTVDAAAWALSGLPSHLRLRVRVVDRDGHELGADRDLSALHERFAGRIKRAQATAARERFASEGITAWDFGDLPARAVEGGAEDGPGGFAALVDRGESVSLTLMDSAEDAERCTLHGVRRLFALASGPEVHGYLRSLAAWGEMARQYAALAGERGLEDDLTCVIAERVFLWGQPAIRTQAEYEERSRAMWGRLASAAREVGEVVGQILEPRARVAQRISGGTPRLWAASVADIREHAAYLMPRGFLLSVPWERLKQYPRYVQGMRERLFALREDGSGVEKEALRVFGPQWKRFTGWVVAAMAAERAGAEEDEKRAARASSAPLPRARRAAPSVNVDAGEWAMQLGRLPGAVVRYRWMLEEYRLALFAPGLAGKGAPGSAEMEEAWKRVGEDV